MNYDQAVMLGKKRSDCAPENIDSLCNWVSNTQRVDGDILEAGPYKCGATIAMAATAQLLADTGMIEKKVYALDLFGEGDGLPYGPGKGFENFADAEYEEIKEAVKPWPNIVLVRGRHEETVPVLAPQLEALSLIFMDSDFYESHVVCLSNLWPKLSPGGVIIFHDWAFPGVQKAIEETLGDKRDQTDRWGTLADERSPNLGIIRKRNG